MGKQILIRFSFLFLGFFLFLLVAPLNKSLAVGEGQNCAFSVNPNRNIKCDANLYCDVSGDNSNECQSDITCRGTCKKIPTNEVPKGAPCTYRTTNPTGGCTGGLTCIPTTCHADESCTGYCGTKVAILGEICTSQSNLGGASAAQGNCASGLVCNTARDQTCNSTSGGCNGVCFPSTYTCNPDADSRSGLNHFSCPYRFSCFEASGKTPESKCVEVDPQFGNCIRYASVCPNCIFSCVPAEDIEVHCSCDNPVGRNVGSGKNGFTCHNNISTKHAYCASSKLGCYNDPNSTNLSGSGNFFPGEVLHGIRCSAVNTNPAPADPPCNAPLDANGKCPSVTTSLGAFNTEPGAFVLRVFAILLASSGAIALLLIMRAGYRIMTSRGNPEGIKEGREQITAAIVGLLFLIFSIVLLQVIAGDLLRIPGFSAGGGGGGSAGGGATAGQGCDMAGNNQCGGVGSGLVCVSNGSARSGVCMKETGQSCDVAGNAPQCPPGQTCTAFGAGRAGSCK